jgi:hypothetical protein
MQHKNSSNLATKGGMNLLDKSLDDGITNGIATLDDILAGPWRLVKTEAMRASCCREAFQYKW